MGSWRPTGPNDRARGNRALRLYPQVGESWAIVGGSTYVRYMSSTAGTIPPPSPIGAMGRARAELNSIGEGGWWRPADADLEEVLSQVSQARQRLAQVEVLAAAEVLRRSLPNEHCMSTVDYLTVVQGRKAPAPAPKHAAQVRRLAEAQAAGLGAESDLAEALDAFCAGRMSPAKAEAILRFHQEAKPISDAEALTEITQIITEGARDDFTPIDRFDPSNEAMQRVPGWTDRQVGVAIRRAMRLIKPAKDTEADEQRLRRGRALHSYPCENGMTEYRMLLDPEGAAIVDSAISALSAPQKGADGSPDERSAACRRADALVEAVARGLSSPGKAPKTEKAKVLVTIRWQVLRNDVRGAGLTMTGQVLSPSTVRKMACDGGIIPVVLGSNSEILNMGRTARLFTPAQRTALWLRDQGCTYPGCTVPAQWCDAHHITWWRNGGPTNLNNAALLCPRHHTHVHHKELTATVDATGITWHT